MSRSLLKLLLDQLRHTQLNMMLTKLDSPERYILIQDARDIKKQLTADTVVAG